MIEPYICCWCFKAHSDLIELENGQFVCKEHKNLALELLKLGVE